MGQEIVYCFKCQTRILGSDFSRGLAIQAGNRAACSKCADFLIKELPEKERIQLWKAMSRKTLAPPDNQKPARSGSGWVPIAKPPPPSPRHSNAIVLSVVITAVVVIAAIWTFSTRRDPEARPTSMPPEPRPSSRPALAVPPAQFPEARAALDSARLSSSDPRSSTAARVKAWESALRVAENTPYAEEARREHRNASAKHQEFLTRELGELDAAVSAAVFKERFKEALDLIETYRKKPESRDSGDALDRRSEDVRLKADRLLAQIKEQLGASVDQAAPSSQTRVASWGLPSAEEELRTAILVWRANRPWRPLLAGKGLAAFQGSPAGWALDGALLVSSGDDPGALQTFEQFTHGELRIRFEIDSVGYLYFNIWHSGTGRMGFNWDRNQTDRWAPGIHEFIAVMKPGGVTGTLDGQAVAPKLEGTASRGTLQLNAVGKLRLHSVDFRPLPTD